MKLVHTARLTVYCKDGEACEEIKACLQGLVPLDLEQEKLAVKETIMKGEHAAEQDIKIYEIMLSKERHVNKFLAALNQKLSKEQRELLVQQAASRFDEDLNFFIRLDKDKLMHENLCQLTDSGECFHIKLSIAAYPKRYDTALAAVKSIFS